MGLEKKTWEQSETHTALQIYTPYLGYVHTVGQSGGGKI